MEDGIADRARRFFHNLGPGLVTGAADDDPSGISTYSVAGATFGFGLLWSVPFSFPMMAAVQIMCARLGLVAGRGLAGAIRVRYPRWVLFVSCGLLAVANVVNIGADLAGMGEATEMVTGVRYQVWVVAFAVAIVLLLIFASYRVIARLFKWLTLVLLAYIVAAFLARPDWPSVLRATLAPRWEWSSTYLSTFLGLLGTTITPYMFFWQAAQEVEEERAQGKKTIHSRRGATAAELRAARTDVLAGMGWAGIVMYFIILTTGATLHQAGVTHISSAQRAAAALKPLAGDFAYWLFTLGILGTGMLGVPVLAGSAAYAVAEAMHWHGSLDDRPRVAAKFYSVVAVSVVLGLALDFVRINPFQALFWAAVVNGLLAPPLVALVTLLTSDPKVMGEHVNPPILKVLGWLTVAVMSLAVVGLGVTTFGRVG